MLTLASFVDVKTLDEAS